MTDVQTIKFVYTVEPIPADTPAWKRKDVERLRESFSTEAYIDQGILFWKSNDRPVPPWSFDEAFCTTYQVQKDAHEAYQRRAIDEYKIARASRSADEIAEERAEMRAELGPDVEVVDIITGERVRT